MIPTLADTSVVCRRNIASRNRTVVIALSAAVAFGSTEVFTETAFAPTWSITVSIVQLLPIPWEFWLCSLLANFNIKIVKEVMFCDVSPMALHLYKFFCCTKNFCHWSNSRRPMSFVVDSVASSPGFLLRCLVLLDSRIRHPRGCSLSTSKRPPPLCRCLQDKHRRDLFYSSTPRPHIVWWHWWW